MPKTKCQCEEERIRKKIKRLEKKLNKNKDASVKIHSPSPPCPQKNPILVPPITTSASSTPIPPYNEDSDDNKGEISDTEHTGIENTEKEEMLDESIIMALGQTVSTEKEYGPEIHQELVKRFEGVITQGLKQEAKDEILKKYLIPLNAKLLDAPKLNKELEGLLNDSIKARDKRVRERQQLIGVALAALLSTTDNLIKDEIDKIRLIESISDVTRLLTDLHHQDTITRKKLIIPNLDKSIGKSIENQKRDEFLFGEKFHDNVKAAAAIKKSASTILKPNNQNRKTTTFTRPNQSQAQHPLKRQGNFRGPPRTNMTQFKQGGGGRYHQQTQQKPRPLHRPPARQPVRQT